MKVAPSKPPIGWSDIKGACPQPQFGDNSITLHYVIFFNIFFMKIFSQKIYFNARLFKGHFQLKSKDSLVKGRKFY